MAAAGTVDRIERLRAVPLFAELDEGALLRLADVANEVDLPAGQVVIEPNTKGSGLFVIVEGTAEVEIRGRRIERGPGDVVGELALLTSSGERTARVRTRTPVRCLAISRADFVAALEASPQLALALLEVLATKLEDAIARR